MRASPIVTAMLCACLAAGCGSGATPDSDPTAPSPVARPSSTASLTIVTPKQDQTIHGSTTPMKVELAGGEIVDGTSTDLQPDEGHLHVVVDDRLVTMTAATESMLTDLTAGQHLLKVEFVANDHAPFDPRVIAAVSFEVKP